MVSVDVKHRVYFQTDSVHRQRGIPASKACLYLMSQPRCLRQTVYTDIQAYRDLRPACTETAATMVSQTIVPQAIPATVSRLQTRLTGSWRHKVRMLCRLISIYKYVQGCETDPLHHPIARSTHHCIRQRKVLSSRA